jgi:hypothetical protein
VVFGGIWWYFLPSYSGVECCVVNLEKRNYLIDIIFIIIDRIMIGSASDIINRTQRSGRTKTFLCSTRLADNWRPRRRSRGDTEGKV